MSRFEAPYTPSSEGGSEKTISKLWELLRRNPRYRHLLRQSSVRFETSGQDHFRRIKQPGSLALRELYRIPILWSSNTDGSSSCDSTILNQELDSSIWPVEKSEEELNANVVDFPHEEIPRINESMCWRETPEGFKDDFRKAVLADEQTIDIVETSAQFDFEEVILELFKELAERENEPQNRCIAKKVFPPRFNPEGSGRSNDDYLRQMHEYQEILKSLENSGYYGDELYSYRPIDSLNRLTSCENLRDRVFSNYRWRRLKPDQQHDIGHILHSEPFSQIFDFVKRNQGNHSKGVQFALSNIGPLGMSSTTKKRIKRQFSEFLEEFDRKAKEESSIEFGSDAEWDQFVLVEWGIPLVGGITPAIGMASYLYPYFRRDKSFENVGILEKVIDNFDKGLERFLGAEYCDSRQEWESHIRKVWHRFNELNENSLIQRIFCKNS